MHPANERWCYTVMPSSISWVHRQNDPCYISLMVDLRYLLQFHGLKYSLLLVIEVFLVPYHSITEQIHNSINYFSKMISFHLSQVWRSFAVLTLWGLDKLDSWTPFSNAFSGMNNMNFDFKILLKFVLRGPNSNIPILVQIMAWCWPGDKPLCEPMMAQFTDYIYVTRHQWVKLTYVWKDCH